jgi:hypothetical protein
MDKGLSGIFPSSRAYYLQNGHTRKTCTRTSTLNSFYTSKEDHLSQMVLLWTKQFDKYAGIILSQVSGK